VHLVPLTTEWHGVDFRQIGRDPPLARGEAEAGALRRGGAAVCSGLQLRREVLGERHPNNIASLNNLAGFP
jgi:hypothetical protein